MSDYTVAAELLAVSLLAFLTLRWYSSSQGKPSLRSVAIVVLGDVGRSPRMMYHAESFARNGFQTYIIGNKGTTPIPSLLSQPCVQLLYLPDPPQSLAGLPFVITAPRKILQQIFTILEALLVRIPQPPEFILVQNPPSIPTLALVWIISRIRGSKVIIDWHNLGYSILALKLGDAHLFVKIAKWFESYFGRSAYAHLFVTKAMRDHLAKEWQLKGELVVLHDRPPAHFHRASPSEMHELFLRLSQARTLFAPSLQSFLPPSFSPYSTPFTSVSQKTTGGDVDFDVEADSPMPVQRIDRPALLLSSTSWTPDEDFGMLLEALTKYDQLAQDAGGKLPKVLMVVTGKGPDREKYMKRVSQLQGDDAKGEEGKQWKFVRCVSMWLEAADYPLLLGSADVGISLHSSSSALDLPMKIVDMFGCGLPVCALDFACLNELVKDGVNGLVFRNAEQLAKQLGNLLVGFPNSASLESLRASLVRNTPMDPSVNLTVDTHSSPHASGTSSHPHGSTSSVEDWEWCSWSQNWNKVMRPLLLTDVHADTTGL